MKPPALPKPKSRAFALEELAFFWNPRKWIPDIVARFDWPGTSDVRDAIIMLDDEGGHGFLHWYADRAAWGLTDKGKRWVEDLLSKGRIRKARDWQPSVKPDPLPETITLRGVTEEPEPEPEPEPSAEPPPPALTREEELAALAAEQAADE